MSKGFTLIELVLTVIVLSILGAFAFSVVWQYSKLYSDTKGGYVYGEAAAVLERITRELRDAAAVDTPWANHINFSLPHGTPANSKTSTWVQYCTCSDASNRRCLYRVQNTSQGAPNRCQAGCPGGANTSLMSRNIWYKNASDPGFQISYFAGSPSPEGDSYQVTLKLASGGSSNVTVVLATRVSPRNFPPAVPGYGRSFNGGYYDESN
jgi:prepilin-type N-terminal cleavage/methylation domain-containing protein